MSITRTCPVCGNKFYSSKGDQKRCSEVCSTAYRRAHFEESFWARVAVGEGCWEWKLKADSGGYARVQIDGRGSPRVMVHRMAWELVRGPVPAGMWVLHKCDNRKCVRVSTDDEQSHLFLGTPLDNTRDMFEKGRANKARGERHGNARLMEKDVVLMRRLHAEGTSLAELAVRFAVHPVYVDKVVKKQRWAHVP